MKKLIKYLGFIILTCGFLVTGCKKDDDNNTTPSTASAILTSGTWRVSYYHDGGDDHTSNFNGYTFTFNTNGTLTATGAGNSTNGTWSNDDSNNEFHMSIGSSSPCSDLNGGWTIISKTNSEVDLKDDNSGHNEELHFVKN